MRINFHETDPMEADATFPKDGKGVVMAVEPAFYGKSRSATICVLSTCTNTGRWLHRYRLKVSDTGKLTLEDLGEPRVLDIDTPPVK